MTSNQDCAARSFYDSCKLFRISGDYLNDGFLQDLLPRFFNVLVTPKGRVMSEEDYSRFGETSPLEIEAGEIVTGPSQTFMPDDGEFARINAAFGRDILPVETVAR